MEKNPYREMLIARVREAQKALDDCDREYADAVFPQAVLELERIMSFADPATLTVDALQALVRRCPNITMALGSVGKVGGDIEIGLWTLGYGGGGSATIGQGATLGKAMEDALAKGKERILQRSK